MRARPLVTFASLAVMLSLAGCGADGSGKVVAKDGGTTGDGGGGGVTPSNRPAPGTPPTSAFGVVSLSSVQKNGKSEFGASGVFTSPPTDTSIGAIKSYLAGYPAIALDACAQLPTISSGGGNSSLLDVGALTFTPKGKSAQTVTKTNFAGMIIYGVTLSLDAFVEDAEHTLAATGGAGSGAFTGTFWTPRALTLTAPSLAATAAVPVSKSAGLDLAWTARADGDPVVVAIRQKDTTVICKAKDDGAFTIPASALANLAATTPPASGESADSISVTKSTWYAVDAPAGKALVLAESGANFEVDIQ